MFNVDERTSVKTARTSLRPRLHSMIHVEIHVCGGHPWLVTFRLCSLIRVIVAVTVTDWEDFCLCCFFAFLLSYTRGRYAETTAPDGGPRAGRPGENWARTAPRTTGPACSAPPRLCVITGGEL